jgi:DNA-directed RNA polymerase subunit beta'
MADILDFDAIQLSVASPTTIKGWSHGEVTKPETINYRTLRPEKGGLFCEKIFGPVKDWECHCGKYKRIRYKGIICDKCGVEVTQSKVRRERMAHISLAAPVAHPWFMRGTPSVLSLLLDLSPRSIDAVIYFSSFIVVSVDEKKKEDIVSNLTGKLETRRNDLRVKADEMIAKLETELQEKLESLKDDTLKKEAKELSKSELELKTRQKIQQLRTELAKEEGRLEEVYKTVNEMVTTIKPLTLLSEDEYYKLYEYDAGEFLEVGMGAESILEVLSKMDLGKLSVELREEASKTTGQRHIKAGKRLRIVEGMRGAKVEPSWMVMQILPVIPPELRPMVQLSGGRFATSDLNDLYRRVINRNNRLKRLIDLGAPSIILRNEKRMLQEAVDALIDSSRKTTSRLSAQAETKSLTDMLQGKQGRFRQNLLGKRVDYSGRSVIVVGPELKLNQMGLPKEMALEMFKPFVLHELIVRGFAPNVKSAKHVLERRSGEVWDILEEITKNHPVLLNRAPTLHKLGIQAFYPILVEGNAIKIHPCVCAGYNADFDGDQMAVHIPLSQKARDEAVELMLASKNLLLPSSGAPITLPNREMSLGCYYLTYTLDEKAAPTKIFADFEEAIFANQAGKLELQTMINVRNKEGKMMQTTVGRILFGEVLPQEIGFVNKLIDGKIIRNLVMQAYETCENETVRKFIDDLKTLGFKYADKAGISIGIADCVMHPDRDSVIEAADQRVTDIDASYKNGLITRDEMRAISNDIWIETTDKVQKMTWDYMKFLNPLKMVVESGARGSKDQVKQLQGMRGLVADPTGRIVDLPTKSNFRLGLMVFEYFTSSRGSRKGFADRALRTSASGYLTRRLVDVAHDVIIREEDCMTPTGFILTRAEFKKHFKERLIGRFMAEDVIDPKTNKVLYPKDTLVTEDIADKIDESPVEFVMGRSPLTCQTRYGMCQKCYGWDVSNKKLVKLGTPVGVIAAQSIGEPGTQLTMRTFHTGGVIGLDITQGLPRVEELVEARIPKNPVPIAEVAGIVEIFETTENIVVRVKTDTKPVEEREYVLPLNADVKVQDGAFVDVGTPLMSGHLDVKQILAVQGLIAAQKYLIAEAQAVYESQGIPIHDKHFEVIARKMCDKVRIETQGDTVLLPGELIDRARFESENAKVMAEGGEPASAQVVILGITKASLYTESFLSAASFQETKNVLTEAAVLGKIDRLIGLKENVILGRLIPTSPERATEILNNQ